MAAQEETQESNEKCRVLCSSVAKDLDLQSTEKQDPLATSPRERDKLLELGVAVQRLIEEYQREGYTTDAAAASARVARWIPTA